MPDFSWYRPQDYVMGGMQQAGQGISQGISAMEAQRQQQAPSGIWESEFAPQADPVQQEIDEAIKAYPQLAQLLDDPNTPMDSVVSIIQSLRQRGQQPQGQPQPQAPQMPQMQAPQQAQAPQQNWGFPSPGLPGGVPWEGGQAPAPAPQPEPYQQAQRTPFGGPDMKPRAEPTGTTRILGNGNPDRQLTNEEFGKKMQMMPFLKNRETLSQKDRYMREKFKTAKELAGQADATKNRDIDRKAGADEDKVQMAMEANKTKLRVSQDRLAGDIAKANATAGAAKARLAAMGDKDDGGLKAASKLLDSALKELKTEADLAGKLQTAKRPYQKDGAARLEEDTVAQEQRAERARAKAEAAQAVVQELLNKPRPQAASGPQGGPPPAQGGNKNSPEALRAWLAKNPNDPKAPAVRAKLNSMGK